MKPIPTLAAVAASVTTTVALHEFYYRKVEGVSFIGILRAYLDPERDALEYYDRHRIGFTDNRP